jgi:hypothetical protein
VVVGVGGAEGVVEGVGDAEGVGDVQPPLMIVLRLTGPGRLTGLSSQGEWRKEFTVLLLLSKS